MLVEQNLERIKKELIDYQRVVIITHKSPDGDAIGSSLGLSYALQAGGIHSTVILPTPSPSYLEWIPGLEQTICAKNLMDTQLQTYFEEADAIFCLDFNALNRIDNSAKFIKDFSKSIILIDHHEEPEDFANILFHEVEASSTSELVYRFLERLGLLAWINKNSALCLYTGMVTDTGCFRYSLSKRVHEIAGKLIFEHELDAVGIHNELFNNQSEPRLRFLGYMLYERLKILPEYKLSYFMHSYHEDVRFGLKEGDSEGIVNFALSIKGISLACYITERPGEVKLSFRSIGKVPAIFFAKHFGGGGHFNAAGANVKNKSLKEIEKELILLVQNNQHLMV